MMLASHATNASDIFQKRRRRRRGSLRNDLTCDYVRSVIDYDPATGVFRWKPRTPEMFTDSARQSKEYKCIRWNEKNAGYPAGTVSTQGYVIICFNGRAYSSHRLA